MQHLLDAVSEVVEAHGVAVRVRGEMPVRVGPHHTIERQRMCLSSHNPLGSMLCVEGCE